MVKGLVIRYCFDKWCVCDGINHDNLSAEENDIFVGHRFSEWFDTWEEANQCRKEIYKTIIEQLEEADGTFNEENYIPAIKYLKKYRKEK